MHKLQEKPSALKRENPAIQNMKILKCMFVGHFALRDLDPDPATQINEINADPCGSGSTTLGLTVNAGSEIDLGSIPASSDTEKSEGDN
jgi:hypothetical protein